MFNKARKITFWRRRSRLNASQAQSLSTEQREIALGGTAITRTVEKGVTSETAAHDAQQTMPIAPDPFVGELDALPSQVQQHEPERSCTVSLPDLGHCSRSMSPQPTSSGNTSSLPQKGPAMTMAGPSSLEKGTDTGPCDRLIEVRRRETKRLRKVNVERPAAKARKKSMTSQEYRSVKLVKYVLAKERRRRKRAEKRVEELEKIRMIDQEESEELTKCLVLLNSDFIEAGKIAAAEVKEAKQDKDALEMVLRTRITAIGLQVRRLQGEKERRAKSEKIRQGVARLVEADLRKQVARLETQNRQHSDTIVHLLDESQDVVREQAPDVEWVSPDVCGQVPRFTLFALGGGHTENSSLRALFLSSWRRRVHESGVEVVRVFRIKVPMDVRRKHIKYTIQVGQTVRRFHGTSCSSGCNFMVDPQVAPPCREDTCNTCSICQQGFKLGKTSRRYGKGVYFSSEAKKAGIYADGTKKKAKDGKTLKCVIVADVAAGRTYTTKKTGFDNAEYPPSGYDSVLGEAGQGLTSDQLVIFSEEAALPTHLIVYAVP